MRKGKKHSEETRKKLSESHKGFKPSEETKLKMKLSAKNSINKGRFKKGSKINLGRKHTKETKKKISLAKIGTPSWNKGKKLNNEKTREKMRKAKLGKPAYWNRGEKSNLWKGGLVSINRKIRDSLEYKIWRRAVFERDNWTCVWCGSKKNIQADHIKPFAMFPELRFAIDNGRTLCRDCHKTTDTWGVNSYNK